MIMVTTEYHIYLDDPQTTLVDCLALIDESLYLYYFKYSLIF